MGPIKLVDKFSSNNYTNGLWLLIMPWSGWKHKCGTQTLLVWLQDSSMSAFYINLGIQ